VVNDPKLSFTQLIAELATAANDEQRTTIRDQLLAKLQRKKRGLNDQSRQDFETAAGMTPEDFIHLVRQMPLAEITGWFAAHGSLSEILDRHAENERPILISDHPDRLLNVEHGYGLAQRPEDYLQAFRKFIEQNQNAIPALVTVLTRPRELTRKQLRDLVIELDNAGFSEVNLVTAWREMTNQEMAAHIVGFIRHIATGDTLVSYESRVDWALQQMLAARPWTNPQREWLKRIASQTKANQVVDRAALDEPSLIFHREGGGFDRLNRIFDSQLTYTLDTFNDLLWSYPPNP